MRETIDGLIRFAPQIQKEFDMDIELEEAVAVEDVGSIYALAHSRLDHA